MDKRPWSIIEEIQTIQQELKDSEHNKNVKKQENMFMSWRNKALERDLQKFNKTLYKAMR